MKKMSQKYRLTSIKHHPPAMLSERLWRRRV